MLHRFADSATVGLALTLSLTACLGGQEPRSGASAAGIVRAALTATWRKTSQVETYDVDETMTYSGFSQEPGDWRRVGEVRLRPSPARSTTFVSGTIGGRSVAGIREIVIGGTEYVRYPALAKLRPGKPWIKTSLRNAWAKDNLDYDAYARQSSKIDSSVEIKILTTSKDARKAGVETIGSTPTTHYTGTISVHDAWAPFDDRTRSQFEQYFQRFGITSVGFDIWVDRDSMPRKLTTRVAGAQGSQTRTAFYSDFDKAVTITAPPRTQVDDPYARRPHRP